MARRHRGPGLPGIRQRMSLEAEFTHVLDSSKTERPLLAWLKAKPTVLSQALPLLQARAGR